MYYPEIDRIIFSIGPLDVRWYGLAYLAAFAMCWWLGTLRANKPGSGWDAQAVSDVVFYGAIGAVLGGRIAEQRAATGPDHRVVGRFGLEPRGDVRVESVEFGVGCRGRRIHGAYARQSTGTRSETSA